MKKLLSNQVQKIKVVIFLLVLAQFISCTRKAENPEIVARDNPPVAISNEQLILSTSQMKAIGLKTGTLEQRNLTGLVKANGYVDVPPQNKAVISPFVSGYIKEVRFLIGDRVGKGQTVTVMESPQYLQIQQQYIELEARLLYLKDEFDRQETLIKENAVSRKKYLQAQSEYKTALSNYNGLREQLKLLGADFNALKGGNVTAFLYVKSPISGTVSAASAVIGRYVDPQEEIFEIINAGHLHLELNVFEKDILKVREGQKVIFSVPNMGGQSYTGKVHLVGQNLDDDRRYIKVHVHPDDGSTHCKVGMYVNASIVVADLPVYALPVRSVVTQGKQEFVFIEKGNGGGTKVFEKISVITGAADQEFVELKLHEGIGPEDRIVTEGAFYMLNAFQGGGE